MNYSAIKQLSNNWTIWKEGHQLRRQTIQVTAIAFMSIVWFVVHLATGSWFLYHLFPSYPCSTAFSLHVIFIIHLSSFHLVLLFPTRTLILIPLSYQPISLSSCFHLFSIFLHFSSFVMSTFFCSFHDAIVSLFSSSLLSVRSHSFLQSPSVLASFFYFPPHYSLCTSFILPSISIIIITP